MIFIEYKLYWGRNQAAAQCDDALFVDPFVQVVSPVDNQRNSFLMMKISSYTVEVL